MINWGGTITSIQLPDKNGKIEDIVTGFASIEDYLGDKNYFGATIGRVANRIANATMVSTRSLPLTRSPPGSR